MEPINTLNAEGNKISAENIEKIKNEIKFVLQEGYLTIGQAIAVLDECKNDIFNDIYQAPFEV